jgi:Flp pilus assembly protein protease CpaA
MGLTSLLYRIQIELLLHGQEYTFYIEIALAAVLFYVGFTDFRTFKIRNDVILLLLVLYVLFVPVAVYGLDRPWFEILWNVVLAASMFAVMLWFFAHRVIGGGDVKFISVVFLWVGTRSALLFSALLLLFIGLHLAAVRMGWAQTKPMAGRHAIPYATSVAAALISIIMLGRL